MIKFQSLLIQIMITIKITNAQEILEREKNWFIAKLAPYFVDVQLQIEKEIAKELEKSLETRNIETIVSVVKND
jgi:hypothetical protein